MSYNKVVLNPGVDVDKTILLNEASWSRSQFVRFFQNMLQKIGGWLRITDTKFIGTCRGIFSWADLVGHTYIAVGTDQRLEAFAGGNLYDITPIDNTVNITPDYSTVSGSSIVTVHDVTHGESEGDWINIVNPISVGGLILLGLYQIQSVIDADNYTIAAASSATATVNNGGAAADFNTTNTSSTVTVTLDDHGFSAGQIYTVYVSTTVATVVLFGDYTIVTAPTADTLTIVAAGTANATTSGFENAGNSRIEYLLASGLASAGSQAGWGIVGYGLGPYGIGGTTYTPSVLRQWSLDAWGELLVASPTQGALYSWDPTAGTFQNPATIISGSPAQQNGFFIAMPQQQIVSFGATDPNTGDQDPMLVRWCDVADFNNWIATVLNQAGSFRLSRGSRIIGGIQGPQYGLLWTDLALWAMQYIQPPLVYGFNQISSGCGLNSLRAMCILQNNVYWMSNGGEQNGSFYVYSGGAVQSIDCPVWDKIFQNMNQEQVDKVCLGASSNFNEFFVFYPSLNGTGENDSYVKRDNDSGAWDYGTLIRTAWMDQSVYGNPMGTDTNGLIQQHEVGYDADGVPLKASATSGWFKINDGSLYLFIERMIPDFILTGGAQVQITIEMADYPSDTPNIYGPFQVNDATEFIIIRGRGRLARVTIASTDNPVDFGTFWRLGECLYLATPSGER